MSATLYTIGFTKSTAEHFFGRLKDAGVRRVVDRLARGVPALLSVGLTRPFSTRPDEPPLHWLQVNNLHLEDDPAWRLSARPGAPTGFRETVNLEVLPF